jgi:hypothetical protein
MMLSKSSDLNATTSNEGGPDKPMGSRGGVDSAGETVEGRRVPLSLSSVATVILLSAACF